MENKSSSEEQTPLLFLSGRTYKQNINSLSCETAEFNSLKYTLKEILADD